MTSPLNIWDLDHGTLGGAADVVLTDLHVILDEGRKIGLELNLEKCELFKQSGS